MQQSHIPTINNFADTDFDKVLPGPYGAPPKEQLEVQPEVVSLVRSQVQALLEASPSYRQIPADEQKQLSQNLVKVAGYSAALLRDQWAVSQQLGQVPLVREQTVVEGENQPIQDEKASNPPPPRTVQQQQAVSQTLADDDRQVAANEFDTRATGNVARITEDTLNAIAFPTFVADLVKGTFQAIVDASIQQMEAYGELLANVAKTVDEFMGDNITDNQARDYLANRYPQAMRLDTSQGSPVLQPTDNADDATTSIRSDLKLGDDVAMDQESSQLKSSQKPPSLTFQAAKKIPKARLMSAPI